MMSPLGRLPVTSRALFVLIMDARAPELLARIDSTLDPDTEDLEASSRVLMDEFMLNIGPDDEPTRRGKEIDELIGVFINTYLIDRDHAR